MIFSLFLFLFPALSSAVAQNAEEPIHTGSWRAWMQTPGGELPFELEIRTDEFLNITATIINGNEKIKVPEVSWVGTKIVFEFPHYDSRIISFLSAGGKRLDGFWEKQRSGDQVARLRFFGVAGKRPRFMTRSSKPVPNPKADGRWAVDFEKDDLPAVGIFATEPNGRITGTFQTTTGDYRFLEGIQEGNQFWLSCFDGAHAFLFNASIGEDGTIAGQFFSGDWHSETWTAKKDPAASLPDAFELTQWTGTKLSELSFPDLRGKKWNLGDSKFEGKAKILFLFGSWCPNCHEATELMTDLHRQYRKRGLSVVGLAFEQTGKLEHDAKQVQRYAEKYSIPYPLLIAGLSNKDKASETFKLVDKVRAYPTTIFLDAQDKVRAVHQGFTGKASPKEFAELRRRWILMVEELLPKE